eukprot:7051684-Pyramimonas_sp.AAC.1
MHENIQPAGKEHYRVPSPSRPRSHASVWPYRIGPVASKWALAWMLCSKVGCPRCTRGPPDHTSCELRVRSASEGGGAEEQDVLGRSGGRR